MYPCPQCPRVYEHMTALCNHLARKHKDKERQVYNRFAKKSTPSLQHKVFEPCFYPISVQVHVLARRHQLPRLRRPPAARARIPEAPLRAGALGGPGRLPAAPRRDRRGHEDGGRRGRGLRDPAPSKVQELPGRRQGLLRAARADLAPAEGARRWAHRSDEVAQIRKHQASMEKMAQYDQLKEEYFQVAWQLDVETCSGCCDIFLKSRLDSVHRSQCRGQGTSSQNQNQDYPRASVTSGGSSDFLLPCPDCGFRSLGLRALKRHGTHVHKEHPDCFLARYIYRSSKISIVQKCNCIFNASCTTARA